MMRKQRHEGASVLLAGTERPWRFIHLCGRNTWSLPREGSPGVYSARITCILPVETDFQLFFIRACSEERSDADLSDR